MIYVCAIFFSICAIIFSRCAIIFFMGPIMFFYVYYIFFLSSRFVFFGFDKYFFHRMFTLAIKRRTFKYCIITFFFIFAYEHS